MSSTHLLAWLGIVWALTAAAVFLVGWEAGTVHAARRADLERRPPADLDVRLIRPRPLGRAGFLHVETVRPLPYDTGPLLLLSEHAAARQQLERDIRDMTADAERRLPPRWSR